MQLLYLRVINDLRDSRIEIGTPVGDGVVVAIGVGAATTISKDTLMNVIILRDSSRANDYIVYLLHLHIPPFFS